MQLVYDKIHCITYQHLITRRMPHLEQELLTLSGHPSSPQVSSVVRVVQSLALCVVCCIYNVCPFVLFHFAIVLFVRLRLTASGYLIGIFKLLLVYSMIFFLGSTYTLAAPNPIPCDVISAWERNKRLWVMCVDYYNN